MWYTQIKFKNMTQKVVEMADNTNEKTLTKEEWIAQVQRQLAYTLPDEFPEGFSHHLAEEAAENGGYDAYREGRYPEGTLWVPTEN